MLFIGNEKLGEKVENIIFIPLKFKFLIGFLVSRTVI